MTTAFSPHGGLIIVTARLWGPAGDAYVRLALDTGATSTLIRPAHLVYLGYDPGTVARRVRMTTGSGVEYVPRVVIDRLEVLRQERMGFEVVAHTLPPTASVDGLLGLDFLRGCELTIDFRSGQIALK
jgi:predicted aspartyl protease